jgi:hypothetical protein
VPLLGCFIFLLFIYLFGFIYFFDFIIHMCIQGLGHCRESISHNRKEQGFLLVEIRIATQGVDSH